MATLQQRLINLKQQAELLTVACNQADPKLIEQAIGRVYAVAGHMAEEQHISWTAVCDCACSEHDDETNG